MADRYNKKRHIDDVETVPVTVRLPQECAKTVLDHINSIYVGTIIRIYDRDYGVEGQLATAHWVTEKGLFVTLHDESKSNFVNLTYQTWVVDHRCVKPGSMLLHFRQGSNDIKDDLRTKTISEVKLRNSRILMNHTVMDFPTEADRQTYQCHLFRLTCNCGYSKKVKKYTCSASNIQNGGKMYYGCADKYNDSEEACNFFVWQHEIEHGELVKCQCGILCKRINISSKGFLPVFKFICINQRNKYHHGCKFVQDA